MFRTPAKKASDPSPPTTPPKVNKSATVTKAQSIRNTGECEAGRVLFPEVTPAVLMQPSRLQEAKAWVMKAKMALNASRNLKTDIKATVTQAIDRLYQIIKEAESGRTACSSAPAPCDADAGERAGPPLPREEEMEVKKPQDIVGKQEVSQLLSSLAEHSRLMRESNEKAEDLKVALQAKTESLGAATYASVAASAKGRKRPEPTALHSVVVASRDEMDTGEDVLGMIRRALKTKEGDIKIDRVRKAKDQKVVISCRNEEERNRVQGKLAAAGEQLEVRVAQNQDPLVIIRDVLSFHENEDILEHLRAQNRKLFRDLAADDDRVEIRFRKKARNALMCHVVAKVSPVLWGRLMEAETVYIDMQHVRVEDQSPLVQCSMCLGYGHSRRLCTETVEKCGHCAGPHQRKTCTEQLANATPTCCNCLAAKLENTGHHAFSRDCPVRRRWDALARAKTAYC